MDIGKSFTFVFEDDQWITKILIAAVILLVGVLFSWVLAIPLILAFALLSGYMVEITRRVMAGQVDGLPEWDDWGALLMDGIKFWVVGIVYALPLIILSICLGIPIGIFHFSCNDNFQLFRFWFRFRFRFHHDKFFLFNLCDISHDVLLFKLFLEIFEYRAEVILDVIYPSER